MSDAFTSLGKPQTEMQRQLLEAAHDSGVTEPALVLRETLGQLRPSVRDKVEGVAQRLERLAGTLTAGRSPGDSE